jgi:hypothetical protein
MILRVVPFVYLLIGLLVAYQNGYLASVTTLQCPGLEAVRMPLVIG